MVVFPDIEAMLIPFLKTHTGVAKVATRVPKDRPVEFIRVWRTGGTASNRVLERPQVTVECWAGSSTRASEIASAARYALLNNLSELPLVRGGEEMTGPHDDPDPDTGSERYTFTVILSVRGKRT